MKRIAIMLPTFLAACVVLSCVSPVLAADYLVKSNDNLWTIAGSDPNLVALYGEINGLDKNNTIKSGDWLVVISAEEFAAALRWCQSQAAEPEGNAYYANCVQRLEAREISANPNDPRGWLHIQEVFDFVKRQYPGFYADADIW